MSSKQLQAYMIRNHVKVPHNNSRLSSIYRLILSLNYDENRKFLLDYKYACYIKYFNTLLEGNINQDLKTKLSMMLSFLISELSTEEYNRVFQIEPPPLPPPPVILRDSGYTFYVMNRITPGRVYFIFKNITANFLLEPLTSYTFDLSDPTNLNTKLSFSQVQGSGIPYRGIEYVSTPGTKGAKMILTVYSDLSTYKVFTFNNMPDIKDKYTWAYSTSGILTHLDNSIVQKIYNYNYLNARQYSYLSVYESSGPKYSVNDIILPTVFLELNQYLYNFTYGTYYFDIPQTFAATLLNKGYEDYISFIGDPNKKFIDYVYGTNTITENIDEGKYKINEGEYSFYYGRVQMNVYKPFPFRFSVYSRSFGFMGGGGLFQFVDNSPEFSKEDTIQNLQVYNTIQKNLLLRFNGDTSTESKRKYGVSVGFYILDIPSTLPIAILNSSKEKLLTVLTTSTTIATGPFVAPDGNEYFFYTGRIHLWVKGYFEKMSVCTRFGYSGGYELLVYNAFYGAQTQSIYTIKDSIPGLCAQNTITVVNNKFISFNDTYEKSSYGMFKGIYTILNIPKEYPITLLNKNKEGLVVLESLQDNSTLKGTAPDGTVYTFYYGILRITVHGDFGYMSLYTLFNGYVGGYKMFVYDPMYDNRISYPDPLSVPFVTDVTPNKIFDEKIGKDNLYIPLALFLEDTTLTYNELYEYTAIYNDVTVTDRIYINDIIYEPNVKFTMKNGVYLFRCMDHYITLLNTGNETSIKLKGVLSNKQTATDGYSYTFYKGDTIAVYVTGNFGMATLEVLGGPIANYVLCHEDNLLE